jgi:hypothetical protein
MFRVPHHGWGALADRSLVRRVSATAAQQRPQPSRPRRLSPRGVENQLEGWPTYLLARQLAGSVFPVSEAVILQAAREHGIGRKMGRAIIFTPEDCQQLYEVLPCRSRSLNAQKAPTGSSGGLSGDAALKKALKLASDRSPRRSELSARPNFSKKPSTVVAHGHVRRGGVELPRSGRREAVP